MLEPIAEIVDSILSGAKDAPLAPTAIEQLRALSEPQLAQLLEKLTQLPVPAPSDPSAVRYAKLLATIEQRWRPAGTESASTAKSAHPPLSAEFLAALAGLYRRLGKPFAPRLHLLGVLTAVRGEKELRLFADLMATDPPGLPVDAALALWPLFPAKDYDSAWIFPRLLDGLAHSSLTASVLDLANYLTREGRVKQHPAQARASGLIELLGAIVGRLGELEGRPVAAGESHQQLRDSVAEGVAMAVSLCDALAQIGDPVATGKLFQALALGHRRLRVEAAAALARLDEEEGRGALVAMAAEPLVRLRALHYADELDLLDRVAPEHRTPEAQAEGELIAWLAGPHRFGLPPQECELLDSRELPWPGYSEPVHCFLFRYVYFLPQGEYPGVGLAGPETLTFSADVSSLPLDDLYAAFAGQSAQHDEIRELDVAELSASGETEVKRLERRLKDAGFTQIKPLVLGYFFGEKTLVADAAREGERGFVVVDNSGEHWFPRVEAPRAPGAREFYCVYKGRRLLAAFGA